MTNYYIHGKNPVTGGRKNLKRYLDKARKYAKEDKYISALSIYTEQDYVMVKSLVRPSMKKGLYFCHATLFKDTGLIMTATCECKVGAVGHCAHIGGVLLRLVRLKNPCTSLLCAWKAPTEKDVVPQRVHEINWWPGKSSADKPWPDQYQASPCVTSLEHAETFRNELLDKLKTANPTCVLYTHLRKSNLDLQPFLKHFDVPFFFGDDVNLKGETPQAVFEEFHNSVVGLPKDEIKELSKLVERATRGQACNMWWNKARQLLLTASYFGRIVCMRDETLPDSLLSYMCGYKSVPLTLAIHHGQKSESKARKHYMKFHQKRCAKDGKLVSVMNVGLVVSVDQPFLGASLDGFVQCPQCGPLALEIKCPWKHRFVHRKTTNILS